MPFLAWSVNSASMDSPNNCDGDRNKTVIIADILAEVDEEDLELYLTNKRTGGGDIEDIQLDASSRMASVKFVDSEGTLLIYTPIANQHLIHIGGIW